MSPRPWKLASTKERGWHLSRVCSMIRQARGHVDRLISERDDYIREVLKEGQMTERQVAEITGLSHSRIHQIKDKSE